MMETPTRQIYSAQGDRRTAFQLPVSKGIILPTALRQPESSNNVVDSYLGVGKVRASSANPSKRLAATRNSIDVTNHFLVNNGGKLSGSYGMEGESPRIVGNNIGQMQLMGKQQQTYDQIKSNSQKMNYITEIMATKPPSGARNISSAGGMGSGLAPSPRVLQQYQNQNSMLLPPGSSVTAMSLNGNGISTGSSSGKASGGTYHLMQRNENVNVQLSSSMPLPTNRTSLDFGAETQSAGPEVVSILSTSSASRKNSVLRSGGVYAKKRVKFAERIAVYAKESDFDPSPHQVINRASTPGHSMLSSIGSLLTQTTIAAAHHVGAPLLPTGLGTQNSQQQGVAFSANMTTGTISFNDNPAAAQAPSNSNSSGNIGIVNNSSGNVKVHSKYNNNPTAQNAIQTVHNTIVNQQAAQDAKAAAVASKLPTIAAKAQTEAADPNKPAASSSTLSGSAAVLTTGLSDVTAPNQISVTTIAPAAAATVGVPSSSAKGAQGQKKKPMRPSLSEQLDSIGAKAEAITSDIRVKGKLESASNGTAASSNGDTALYTMPARCFSIGSLSCRFPSPIHFFGDRCEYVFNHPFEATAVNMVLYYRDMSAISILGTKFKFKLPKRLACFLTDFDPQNPHHVISVELSSMLSVSVIREKVLPIISTFK